MFIVKNYCLNAHISTQQSILSHCVGFLYIKKQSKRSRLTSRDSRGYLNLNLVLTYQQIS